MSGILGSANNGPAYSGWVRIPGGVPVPLNALANYQYNQTNLVEAITELVNRQSVLLTVRASDVNVIQLDGSIRTFGPGEAAFVIAVGVLIQGTATTQIVTNMSIWDSMVNVVNTYDSNTKISTMVFSAVVANHFTLANSSVTIGLPYVMSLRVKKGDYRYMQITGSVGFSSTAVINFDLQDVLLNVVSGAATATIEDQGEFVGITYTQDSNSTQASGRIIIGVAADLNSLRLPALDVDGEQFQIQYPNFVQSSFASSPIDAPTAPATRLADNSTISTLLELGLLSDKDGNGGVFVTTGDFTGGTWMNGVNTAASELTFFQTSGIEGKYVGLVSALFIGAIFTASNGATLEIVSTAGSGTLGYSVIKGTDAEIQAGFENDGTSSNPFDIDFATSGYFTDQAQLAIDRAAAGDTLLASLPAVEGWPVNNSKITFTFEYRGHAGSVGRLLETGTAATQRVLLFTGTQAGGSITFRIDSTGADRSATLTVVGGLVIGTSYTFILTNDSVNGIKVEHVGGNTGIDTVPVDAAWLTPLRQGAGEGGIDPVNMLNPTFLLEPL